MVALPTSPNDVPTIFDIAEAHSHKLAAGEATAAKAVVAAYATAWKEIKGKLDAVTTQIAESKKAGAPNLVALQASSTQLHALLNQVKTEIASVAQLVDKTVTFEQKAAVQASLKYAQKSMQAAVGKLPDGTPGHTIDFLVIAAPEVEKLVGFLGDGSPLAALLDQLGPDAAQRVKNGLTTGVILGEGAEAIARRVRDGLAGNMGRALTIARTEVLRAARTAAVDSYRLNDDVFDGWIWHAAVDSSRRPCPACFALHGSFHTLDETLDGHVRCRCQPIPHVKPWKDLGFDVKNAHDVAYPKGPDVFAKLPAAAQLQILGPKKFALLQSGQIGLVDLVIRTSHGAWGTMRHEATIAQALANAKQGTPTWFTKAPPAPGTNPSTPLPHFEPPITYSKGASVLVLAGSHAGKTGKVVKQAGGFVKVSFGGAPATLWFEHIQDAAIPAPFGTFAPPKAPVAPTPAPAPAPAPAPPKPAAPKPVTAPVTPPPAPPAPATPAPATPAPAPKPVPSAGLPFALDALKRHPAEEALVSGVGVHAKEVYQAPDGSLWLFKPQPAFKSAVDVAAYQIAKAVKFAPATSETYAVELGGRAGSLQRMHGSAAAGTRRDAFGKFGDFDPSKIDEHDIAELQKHAVFDWLIGNHDAHAKQFIRLKGDRTVYGIDKGSAFRFFGADKLDYRYGPLTSTVYNQLHEAWASGKSIAGFGNLARGKSAAAEQLRTFIDQVQALDDATYRTLLQPYAEAAAGAGQLATNAKGLRNNVDAFLDAAVARKRSLLDDWTAYHERLQAQRDVVLPPPPPPPPGLQGMDGALEHASDSAGVAWAKKHWNDATLSAPEREALRTYTGGRAT